MKQNLNNSEPKETKLQKNHNRVNNNDSWANINESGKIILYKKEYEMSTVKKNDFERIEVGKIIRKSNGIQVNKGEN